MRSRLGNVLLLHYHLNVSKWLSKMIVKFFGGVLSMLAIPSWGCFNVFHQIFTLFFWSKNPPSRWPQCLGSKPIALGLCDGRPVATVSEQQPKQLDEAELKLGDWATRALVTPTATKGPEILRFSGETKGETTGIAVMFLGDSSQ